MKKISALFLTVILALSFIGCSKPATEGKDSTKANEKKFEGTTLKISLAYGGAEKTFEKFTKKTGIKVEYVSMSTGEGLAKLKAENGNTTNDVWFGGGVDSYIAGRDLGYLDAYISKEADKINPQYKEKNGYYTGLALVPVGFIVNNDILKEKNLEAPKTWADLADPKYKDEIIVADPAISGTNYAMVSGLIQAWGEDKAWDYFKKLNDNVSFYAKSGGEPQQKVVAGEYAIGIVALTGSVYEAEKDKPVKVIAPQDLIPWTPAPIGIFKNSKNKEAAKVLVDYYLSAEGQEVLREADPRVMARSDVKAPEVMKAVDTNKLVKLDLELMGKDRDKILGKWKTVKGAK
jgi:iron(III) transport system substrate-binding protein